MATNIPTYLPIYLHTCMYIHTYTNMYTYRYTHVHTYIKEPLIGNSRASCPDGRCPPSFIHQVIIITGLNNGLRCRQGRKPPLKPNPVPLIEKRRGLSPGGRFPPSFIHQLIIITGLNKLQLYVLALEMALDADRA